MPRRSRERRDAALSKLTARIEAAAAAGRACPLVHLVPPGAPATCPQCGQPQYLLAPPTVVEVRAQEPEDLDEELP